jgi:Xaa-Pro aminopeptidase
MANGSNRQDSAARLEADLQDAGFAGGAKALRELIAGVLAAPQGLDPEAWLALVADPLPDRARARLIGLKAELASALPASYAATRATAGERLAALRRELAGRGLDGFLVPRADEHQGEYVARRADRLAWLTGFTGSAGLAVVLAETAAIFVDGRYVLQVRNQTDGDLYQWRHLIETPPQSWIEDNLPAGARLGFDPWLHAQSQAASLAEAAEKAGGALVACADNPLDAVWPDQPPPPIAPAVPHPLEFAGRSSADKRRDLGGALAAKGADAAVLSLPDSIAWLLNVRGADVPHTPLVLSFAILHADGRVDWFVDRRKFVAGLADHLGDEVTVHPPEALGPALDRLGAEGRAVQADPASAAAWIFDRLEAAGATLIKDSDPCLLPKARKNPVELAGARRAHERDGAALTRFLAWLSRTAAGAAQAGDNIGISEIDAADRLAAFRRENAELRDLSFDTISGSGPNGAIMHYRVDEESDRRLGLGELYLVDSGGQYPDGTTDVTRTVAIGAPSAEMRERNTRVLKGHIAIARARFPRGTSGGQIDSLARLALWQAGLDFDHGTGHGVGSYLAVHEGPQRISKSGSATPLEPGMIVSNEPGYYKEGAYGIRIENLVTVVESEKRPGEEKDMLAFETLTLAPFDRALIDADLLDEKEVAWVDAYHARVRETLGPLVDPETRTWLAEATRPLNA